MRAIHTFKLAGGVLVALACLSGYARPTDSANTQAASVPDAQAERLADRQLAAAVRSALKKARGQGLRSAYIRVRTSNGVVTLSGVVANPMQIELAATAAKGVTGVTTVISRLVVSAERN